MIESSLSSSPRIRMNESSPPSICNRSQEHFLIQSAAAAAAVWVCVGQVSAIVGILRGRCRYDANADFFDGGLLPSHRHDVIRYNATNHHYHCCCKVMALLQADGNYDM